MLGLTNCIFGSSFYTVSVRLAVYADLIYWQDSNGISTSTAFVSWLGGLSEYVDGLVVLGRTHPVPGRADYELAGAGIQFVPLPYYRSLHEITSVAAATFRSAARWREEIGQCDAALVFGPHPYSAVFGLQTRLAHVPLVVGVRQDFPKYLAQRTRDWRRLAAIPTGYGLELVHRRLAKGGGVVAVGDEMSQRYSHRGTRVLTTGVSLVRPADLVPLPEVLSRPWPGEHQALVAGRLDPEKNPLLLIEIAKELRRIGPWKLVVAGTGSLASELAAQVKSQSLDEVVTLVGRLDRDRLFQLYRQSTVLIHVSLTEGQPQVFYEAAAAGLPIIATAVGGVRIALGDGKRGVLVQPDNAMAIADAVSKLSAEQTLRKAMVEAAWKWSATETLDAQVARVATFIDEIVSAGGRRSNRLGARRRLGHSSNRC